MPRNNNRANDTRSRRNRDRSSWSRTRQDALSGLLSASLAASRAGEVLGGQGTDFRAPRTAQGMSKDAANERVIIGLVRQALNNGASVSDIAAATGRSKAWVRSHLADRAVTR